MLLTMHCNSHMAVGALLVLIKNFDKYLRPITGTS